MKYLNLGCGSQFHPDWTNIDFFSRQKGVIAHDLRQGIPFEDASFDVVYHSHILEYFRPQEAKEFLEECHRVLRPEGLIRVVVPDLAQIAQSYIQALEKVSQGSLESATNYAEILGEMFEQADGQKSGGENISKVPQWMYDRYSLERLLIKTGFTDIKVCQANESRIPNFNEFGLDVQRNSQLFVEARETRPNQWRQVFISSPKQEATLKVIQLNTTDIAGGAARAAYRLHKGLQEAGQESLMLTKYKASTDETVCLVQSPPEQELSQQAAFSALQTHYINENRTDVSNTLFNFTYPGWDISEVEEVQEADIIQLHWIANFQSPQTLKRLGTLGKPIVWTLHDMWAFTGGCHYSAGCQGYQFTCDSCPQIKEDTFGLATAILQDKLDLLAGMNLTIVTPSYWLADCVGKSALFKHQRVEVIPNGIETDRFVPINKAEAKQRLGIKTNTFTLLIGAENGNEKRKGFWEMLKALEICLKDQAFSAAAQQGRIKLLCFGVPNENLSSLKIPVVAFGQINSDEKLAEVYSAADIFILPSLEDNLPNTMLESMSCGTPVLGFEVGGLLDVVKEDITGKLVPVGDYIGLAQRILNYFATPEKIEQMGKNCRRVMEEKYSLSVQGEAYLKLYQELLSQSQSVRSKDVEQSLSDAVISPLNKKVVGIFAPMETQFNSVSRLTLESALRHALSQELTQTKAQLKQLNAAISTGGNEFQLVRQQVAQQLSSERQQHQQQIQVLTEEIEAMKTSKFWKVRSLWFKIKKTLGLPIE